MHPDPSVPLTSEQRALAARPLNARIFLEGPAGAGKTTCGRKRLRFLLDQGVPAGEILLLVPQRVYANPYLPARLEEGGENDPSLQNGAVQALTLAGLAQRAIEKFWLLAAAEAGFAAPDRPPVFLNVETAQYFLARVIAPLLEDGYFNSITLERRSLYSQILNNLNRAASVGFPHTEIGERLRSAWTGAKERERMYSDLQECANRFRAYCLEHNLLDFSLQIEVFTRRLWRLPACRSWLLETYRHLIADNLEEGTPVLHDLLYAWLPDCASALLIYDWEGGYRTILAADPVTAYRLKERCQEQVSFERSFVTPPELEAWIPFLGRALSRTQVRPEIRPARDGELRLHLEARRLYPQMLDWAADETAALVHEQGLPPAEIALLAPYVPDTLRFALEQRLRSRGVALRTHRPSRPLRDEAPVQCLLTLAALAHPGWGSPPAQADVRAALVQAIQGLDPVRAGLLAEIVYRVREGEPYLTAFDRLREPIQARITPELGERYESLRLWLEEYRQEPEEAFDRFLMRLYAELLSQPGYGFSGDEAAEEMAANLIDSAQNFARAVGGWAGQEGRNLGREFVASVQEGLMAASYLRGWQAGPEGAVLLAPVATFLSSNRPVTVQFWLNAGSPAWYERPEQPLGHPYVLSRHWPPGRPWTDVEEYEAAQETLYRLAVGLVRRCRERVYLGHSELSEQGYEQRGMLLRAYERILSVLNEPAGEAQSDSSAGRG